MGKSSFIEGYIGKSMSELKRQMGFMGGNRNQDFEYDCYQKEIEETKPPIVVQLMREEQVKFNRTTYMRARVAILILEGSSSEEDMKKELERYATMVSENCKEDIIKVCIINKKAELELPDPVLSMDTKLIYPETIGIGGIPFYEIDVT